MNSTSVTLTVQGESNHRIEGITYSFINYADPALSAVITASGQPNEGQSYSLTCEVRGDERLAVSSSTLRWDKDGREYSRNPTLTFNPLRPDDAGEYRCTSNFSSPYLTGSRTVIQTRTVTVNSKYVSGSAIAL